MDNIDNKVMFGVAYPLCDDIPNMIHGRPLEARFLRVSVDGTIKLDTLLLVPVIY